MSATHYDGSPCPESCPCASREVERLRAQLEAVTRERDELLTVSLRGNLEATTLELETAHTFATLKRDLEVARIYAADREGLALQLDAARETIQFGIELRQKAERERDEARESEARMRAVVQSQFSAILLSTTDPTVRDMVTTFRAALSAPAPEPSERMMRVAEAVLAHFTTAFTALFGEQAAKDIRSTVDLRAIVAKATP